MDYHRASNHSPSNITELISFMEKLVINFETKSDPRVQRWWLAGSPIPIAAIVISYLTIVWLGPRIMKDREPVHLRSIIIPYNFFLVILSTYMTHELFMSAALSRYSLICEPTDYSNTPLALRMANVSWVYGVSKIIELLETVFFILRKKNNQVSFLHVYHHSTMIIVGYLATKFVPGGQSFFVALVNSFVHIWMYLYYGLAAIGPHMQKYLGWKRHLTSLQLIQFVSFILHSTYSLTRPDCRSPQLFNACILWYATTLIILFGNYYHKEYVLRQKECERRQKQKSS